jgi:alcohol dehydrogenase
MHLPIYYEYGSRVNIIAGVEALEKIPGLLQRWAARRPMLITGKDILAAGLTDLVARSLLPGISVGAVLDDVEANADAALINRMVQVFRESACDAILAVGGGSVLDSAKVINIALAHGADDWPRCAGADSLKHPLKPLIAIPTTAGSGSEVSPVGWAAARCDLIQRALACRMLLPHAAVLDPRMTLSLCSEITAASAMEALSHAMEAYTCLDKNPISDAHAFSAIRLISENLFHVLKAPGDPKGRLALAVGACLA